MNIKGLIKENIISPEMSQYSSSTIGTIVSIDENRLATVELSGRTGDKFMLERIPIVQQGRGIVLNTYYPGDKVIVSYSANNINAAKITGVYNKNVRQFKYDNEHKEQELLLNIDKKEINKVMTQEELYFSDTKEITDFTKSYDFNKSIYEDFNNIGSYGVNDVGITHPKTKSTIKCMNDGSILISSGLDTCIIINKDGEVSINSKKIKITSSLGMDINCSKDINIECNKLNLTEKGGV